MKILAIDSCSMVATGAILDGDRLTAEFVLNNDKTHSVKLLPQIENMMKTADTEFSEIDVFAVTNGPGSFTGQRIGMATAKALAHGCNKPVRTVSSLMSMAYNVPFFDGIICPIMDARREQVYNALYKWENGKLITLADDRALALAALLEELKGKKAVFLGDGVKPFYEKIKNTLGDNAFIPPLHLIHLRGGSVAKCALDNGIDITYGEAVPKYLRPSQAEREYNDRNRK